MITDKTIDALNKESTKVSRTALQPPEEVEEASGHELAREELFGYVYGSTAGNPNFPGDTKKIVAALAFVYAELKTSNKTIDKT